MMDFFVVEPCSSSNGIEIRLKERKLDLEKTASLFEPVGTSPVVLLVKFKGYAVSLYSSGRIMIKGSKKISSKVGNSLAKDLIALLEKNNAIID